MKRVIKLFCVTFLVCLYALGGTILRLYAVTDANRRRVSAWWTHKICRMGTRVLEIRIDQVNIPGKTGKGRLIVSNHMSYLDIFIYSSVRPAVYVSSVEIEQTFFLGFMAKIGGTFFVERRNPKNLVSELALLKQILDSGLDVVLFPEGTSTDGSKILPFRSSFLAGAVETGADIIPACIRYTQVNGKPFGEDTRDGVCWYGDMSFAPHFLKLTGFSGNRASTEFFQPMSTRGADRKELSRMTRDMITRAYFGAA